MLVPAEPRRAVPDSGGVVTFVGLGVAHSSSLLPPDLIHGAHELSLVALDIMLPAEFTDADAICPFDAMRIDEFLESIALPQSQVVQSKCTRVLWHRRIDDSKARY